MEYYIDWIVMMMIFDDGDGDMMMRMTIAKMILVVMMMMAITKMKLVVMMKMMMTIADSSFLTTFISKLCYSILCSSAIPCLVRLIWRSSLWTWWGHLTRSGMLGYCYPLR